MGVVTDCQHGQAMIKNEKGLTSNNEGREPVYSGGNTGCWSTVSGGDNFLRVEEVDTEETDWVKGNEHKGENDGNVCWDEVILSDLRSTDSQAELDVSVCLPCLKGGIGDLPYKCSYLKRQ
jgi:predicted NBD/HSP70 family sugar kinase